MRLGAWRLTRLIGSGGMGDVYEGTRICGDFEQRVAVKLLQRDTVGASKRFQTERQILARMDHAGIARLYDGGVTDDGRLYMVMEYVEGLSVTDFCMKLLEHLKAVAGFQPNDAGAFTARRRSTFDLAKSIP